MLQLKQVAKHYRQGQVIINALNQVNLSVEKGEIISIIGKSGSGKTTLLKVIGCLLPPTQGQVFFEGKNIYDVSKTQQCIFRRKKVGFVYQSFDLIPELTAYENIILPLLLDKRNVDTPAVFSLCEEIGILDKQDRYPIELSGGEQQRVAFARAIIHNPDLLLMDEPTGNLDQNTAKQILDLIIHINQTKKTTMLLVTHDQDIAKKAHRRVIIQDGVLGAL